MLVVLSDEPIEDLEKFVNEIRDVMFSSHLDQAVYLIVDLLCGGFGRDSLVSQGQNVS